MKYVYTFLLGLLLLNVNAQFVINEVDADQPAADTQEFVEIYGTPGASLNGFLLVFFNGNADGVNSYLTVDLTGNTIPASGYFVYGNIAVPNVNVVAADNSIQNGPDAVALIQAPAASWPNDTPASNVGVIDALVYGTADVDATGLIAALTPGQIQVDEGAGNNTYSSSRLPDGGSPFAINTYVAQAPTPGASNAGIVSGCTNNSACNYNALATLDNGTCAFPGDACNDGNANTASDLYDATCTCIGFLSGCTDPTACNYDSNELLDNGTCAFPGDACNDGDANTANDIYDALCGCAGTPTGASAVAVTFEVDMTGLPVSPNGVHLAGNFNDVNYDGVVENAAYVNWDPTALGLINIGNGKYRIALNLVPAHYEFKFLNGADWLHVETVPETCQYGVNGNDNRWLDVTGENTTEAYQICYQSCAPCGQNAVRFSVDMTQEASGVNPIGIYVAGNFNSWDPTASRLHDFDNNGIWEGFVNVGSLTNIEYMFVNGNDLTFSESVPTQCSTPNLTRTAVVSENTSLPTTCFSSCGLCLAPTPVMFLCDMTNQIVNPANPPHVAGSFQNWNPADTNFQMLNFDGDNIWELTVLLQPGTYQYKFVNGSQWSDGNEFPPAECSIGDARIVVVGADPIYEHWCYNQCGSACYPVTSGCADPAACNYDNLASGYIDCTYPGCTSSNACNFNPTAGCDDGSCYFINSPCNDNNPNTYNDVYNTSCTCSGSLFSYGNLSNSSVNLCTGESMQIAMVYEPVGLPAYTLQWYYKSGIVNAPVGGSTAGWVAVSGATSSVVDITTFVGSRTYACFVTTDGSQGVTSQWANGASYVTYSSINAQAIIGNPNVTPFNNYTYAVTAVPGHTYNWTVSNGAVISGQGTSVVSIMWGQNGPYQVTLNESDGTCSGTSVLFAVNNNCTLAVSAASATTTSFCSGASVQLQAATTATNITYQWYLNGVAIAGETNQNISASVGGNYQVSITQNGCSAISQILAITELPGITTPTLVVDQANAGCSGSDATVSLTDANYSSITWSNGTVNTPSINVSESGSYSVTVTDNNGCTATSSPVDVNLSLVSVVPICLVTVDEATGKNNVVWEPVTSDLINSYVVLKETNVANEYAQIGTVAYGSNGLFEDVNSNPQVQANRYKLALIDTCGVLSSTSSYHKTIHLTTNQGLGNTVNLIWSGYEGFDFGSYNIYRGASAATMTLLTTIASNLNSYTDVNPPSGDLYYMIEVEGVSCSPDRSTIYSHSNIINTTIDGVEELTNAINLYPNPASTNITLQVNSNLVGKELMIYDATGKLIHQQKILSTQTPISLYQMATGHYMLRIGEEIKQFEIIK
jgi:hypothetical protein